MIPPLIIFEHRSRPVLSRGAFLRRMAMSVVVGGSLVAVSLAGGMIGYHVLVSLSWLDSFVNASMILSGMGPVANPQTDAGKLFAGSYALYSGLVVVLASGVIFAPLFHRIIHKFHAEEDEDARDAPADRNVISGTRGAPKKPAASRRKK
ncbi:MAG: hypothetical protein ABJB04_08030 [Betaproteobacteria bacterium]